MSNQLELSAEAREVTGKQVRRLRREGLVPANVYGRDQESKALQVSEADLQKLLARGGNRIIQLKLGNRESFQVQIKQVQRDPISGKLLNVDLYRLPTSQTLKSQVQLRFINAKEGPTQGRFAVSRPLHAVMVEALPAALPASIPVDLSQLQEPGDVIRVGDLEVGPEVTILTDPNELVAAMQMRAQGVQAEETESSAEAGETGTEAA